MNPVRVWDSCVFSWCPCVPLVWLQGWLCVCCLLSAGDAHRAATNRDAARWTVKSAARGEWLVDVVSHTTHGFYAFWEHCRDTWSLLCFCPFQSVFLSVFMFQLLRTVGLRTFSMASETYSSGTHSAAFVTCPNDTVATDLARWRANMLANVKIKPLHNNVKKLCPSLSLSRTHTEALWRRNWLPVSTLSLQSNLCKLVWTEGDGWYSESVMSVTPLVCAHPPDMSGRGKLKRTARSCWLVCTEILGFNKSIYCLQHVL